MVSRQSNSGEFSQTWKRLVATSTDNHCSSHPISLNILNPWTLIWWHPKPSSQHSLTWLTTTKKSQANMTLCISSKQGTEKTFPIKDLSREIRKASDSFRLLFAVPSLLPFGDYVEVGCKKIKFTTFPLHRHDPCLSLSYRDMLMTLLWEWSSFHLHLIVNRVRW